MNVQLLIDSIVRQTTVLIAQLATAGGARTPLARIAAQVFVELAAELEAQGLSRKVTADMFGISLRSYQRKVQRLRESRTEQGRSLWEAVFDHIAERGLIARRDVLERFKRDDAQSVRGILRDLVESGLLFMTGSGEEALYRAATENELGQAASGERGADALAWALIYREGPLSRAQLHERLALEDSALDALHARLVQQGRVERDERGLEPVYRSERLVLEPSAAGWEAAVYDHFQAVVRTVCARLDRDTANEGYREYIGGSTYSLDVGPEHPLRAEVLGTLARVRAQLGDLRQRVNAHNAAVAPEQRGLRERVVIYAGQCVLPEASTDKEMA
jgi:DNA-binding MarR family transcriptional regulator